MKKNPPKGRLLFSADIFDCASVDRDSAFSLRVEFTQQAYDLIHDAVFIRSRVAVRDYEIEAYDCPGFTESDLQVVESKGRVEDF